VFVPLHDPSDGNIEVVFRLDLSEERVQRPQLTAFRCSTTLDLFAEAMPVFGINMQRFFGFDGLGQAGRQISNYCDCSSSIASIHNEEPE
jgi:hypothetical protein